jgi:hypothetical protein
VSRGLIQVGQTYAVDPVNGGESLSIRCLDVEQRNWSRVGTAEYTDQHGNAQRCFVKQYLDKAAEQHADHWDYERDGAVVARQLLGKVVHVPAILFRNNELLLNIFEFSEVISIDILLRNDATVFDEIIVSVLGRMADVLTALKNPPPDFDADSLTIKQRTYGGHSTAVNFKGFEIRNTGIVPGAGTDLKASDLVLFDFVRPYMAPIEEAAAKLFVSIGLLNWGSPLSRFIKGPDKNLLTEAARILGPWLDAEAISAELDLQEKFRTAEFKGAGGLEVFLKRLGVDLLGKLYLRNLRRWCRGNITRTT